MDKENNTHEENAGFEIDMPDFNLDLDLADFDIQGSTMEETRYQKPRFYQPQPEQNIKYDNAVTLARELRLDPGGRANVIVGGYFIFGDFLEAYVVEHNIQIRKMNISTLSMSQDNVDSLANLLNGGFVQELNLIVSYYFFSHERKALIPYIYENLDIDNRFQLAVAASHTKTITFDTAGGKKMVIHGSANLRSSNNLEQFTIEDNPELYDFYNEYQDRIIEKYKTINKPTLGKAFWNIVTTKKFK